MIEQSTRLTLPELHQEASRLQDEAVSLFASAPELGAVGAAYFDPEEVSNRVPTSLSFQRGNFRYTVTYAFRKDDAWDRFSTTEFDLSRRELFPGTTNNDLAIRIHRSNLGNNDGSSVLEAGYHPSGPFNLQIPSTIEKVLADFKRAA